MKSLLALPLVLLLATPALADVLVLDDGSEISGDVRRVTADGRDGYEVDGTFVDRARVARYILGRDTADDPGARSARYRSVERATANATDAADAVAKWQQFLSLEPDEPEATAAREALATWEDRADRSLVRVGDAWMTSDEAGKLAGDIFDRVDAARAAVADGRSDAEALASALTGDALTDVSGRYLLGVIAMSAESWGKARGELERVRTQAPQHAPTLNNLAVIQAELGHPERATRLLADAATASPGSQQVLDNASELLRLLQNRRDGNVERLERVVAPQEIQLRQDMEAAGWFRWGSAWVDAEQMETLTAATEAVEKRVAEIEKQQQDVTDEIATTDATIRSIQSARKAMEEQTLKVDENGNLVRLPLPAAHSQLSAELTRLETSRSRLAEEVETLSASIREARQEIPQPTFTGRLEAVGADGVPVNLPTTRPAG